jgi:hypothetical protein
VVAQDGSPAPSAKRKRGMKLAKKIRGRLTRAVKRGWITAQRMALPLAVVGQQLSKFGPEGVEYGRQLLEEAVAIDPSMCVLTRRAHAHCRYMLRLAAVMLHS